MEGISIVQIDGVINRRERFFRDSDNYDYEKLVTSKIINSETFRNYFPWLSKFLNENFVENIFGKKHHFRSFQKEIETENIFGWTQLNEILTSNTLEFPRLFLVKDKQKVDPNLYCKNISFSRSGNKTRIDFVSIQKLVKNGNTLVVNRVDELNKSIAQICEQLSVFFSVDVHSNLYVSSGQSEGFGLHWDDHDVIILQLDGKKEWKMGGFTRINPLFRDTILPKTPDNNSISKPFFISEGDLLYIPRGMWHTAKSIGKPSMHLTFTISTLTGLDFMHWILDETLESNLIRSNIPIFSTQQEKTNFVENLKSIIAKEINHKKLEKFILNKKLKINQRPFFSMPFSINSDMKLASDTKLKFIGLNLFKESSNTEIIKYYFSNKILKINPSYEKLIDYIVISEYFYPKGLNEQLSGVSAKERDNIIYTLLEEGFIGIL